MIHGFLKLDWFSCVGRCSAQDVQDARYFICEHLTYSIQRLMTLQYLERWNLSPKGVLDAIMELISLTVMLEQKGLGASGKVGSSKDEWLTFMATCFHLFGIVLDSFVKNSDQLSMWLDDWSVSVSPGYLHDRFIEQYVHQSQSMDACHQVSFN